MYEKPIILEIEDLAEGIYAGSGVVIDFNNDTDCWSLEVIKDQVIAHEGKVNFRIKAVHPPKLHISSKTTITVMFNQPISSANFEGNPVKIMGCTVVAERGYLANSYMSGDNYNSMLQVVCDDPDTLMVVSSIISCEHSTNVQGGFD